MKHSLLRLSILALLLMVKMAVFAFEVDGIAYQITSNSELTVEVISKRKGYGGEVKIPESVNYNGKTYSVTSIGGSAFKSCNRIETVTIGNNVTSIGNNAFKDCWYMTSVTIPHSVTSIGVNAFSGCFSLTSVVIPNSAISIGNSAFKGCSSLTSIIIPNTITKIEDNTFDGCSGLTSLIIGNSVTSIGLNAFNGCISLTSLEIPNSVTSIGNKAFENCSGLTSLIIPNTITHIGDYTFSRCSSLTSVVIPNSVESIGLMAFWQCDKMASITFGNGLVSIGKTAFAGCSELTEVIIPDNVQELGEGAFSSCGKLRFISFGKGLESMGGGVVDNCGKLEEVFINCSIVKGWFQQAKSIKKVVIGDNTKKIDDKSFWYCENLESVTFKGESLTYIGSNAFEWTKLSSITFPQSLKIIKDYAFNKSRITNIVIPKNVESIGNNAFSNIRVTKDTINVRFENGNKYLKGGTNIFYTGDSDNKYVIYCGRNSDDLNDFFPHDQILQVTFGDSVSILRGLSGCKNLQRIYISDNVSEIRGYAFSQCHSLDSVYLPNSITTIGAHAFDCATALSVINIPSNLSVIKEYTFYGTKVLTKPFIIPQSVTKIEDRAFAGGHSGDKIIFESPIAPTIHHYAFSNPYNENNTLHVPRGSVGAYLHADGDPTLIDPPTVTPPDDEGRIYYYSRYIVNCRFTEYDNIEDIFSGTISPSHIDNTTINVENNNDMFDLKGIKIGSNKKPSKGIYIKNGKKVIIK